MMEKFRTPTNIKKAQASETYQADVRQAAYTADEAIRLGVLHPSERNRYLANSMVENRPDFGVDIYTQKRGKEIAAENERLRGAGDFAAFAASPASLGAQAALADAKGRAHGASAFTTWNGSGKSKANGADNVRHQSRVGAMLELNQIVPENTALQAAYQAQTGGRHMNSFLDSDPAVRVARAFPELKEPAILQAMQYWGKGWGGGLTQQQQSEGNAGLLGLMKERLPPEIASTASSDLVHQLPAAISTMRDGQALPAGQAIPPEFLRAVGENFHGKPEPAPSISGFARSILSKYF